MQPLRFLASIAFSVLLVSSSMALGPDWPAWPPALPSQPPAAQAAPPGGNPDAAVVRANANLVLVDVVVTDRDSAVRGLDRKRFRVLEDGREQAIASFDEHRPGAATGAAASTGAQTGPLPPHTFTNVPPYPGASAVNVLLLDGLNTPIVNQMDVRRRMLEFMGKIEPGTSLAIFTLASRLRMVEGFTTNVPELIAALKSSKAGAQQSVMLDPQGDQAVDSTMADLAAVGGGSDAIGAMQQFQADLTAFQTDQRVQMTMEAMQQLARYLSGVPGRKNLIWFSGSFPMALDPDDSLASPFSAMRSYADQIRETSELLSAARVAVYPVDARGLITPPTLDASYTASTNLTGGGSSRRRGGSAAANPMNRPSISKDNQNFTRKLMEEQASMAQLAEQTGGRAYMNTNGLNEAVASAIENGSSYYTIGYVPAGKPFDGQFRKIDLRVDNPAYKLAYWRGYYADPPDKPSAHDPSPPSLVMAATLHGAPPATQILFQARVLPATDSALEGTRLPEGPAGAMTAGLKEPVHRVIVDMKVDPLGLTLDDAPGGSHRDKIEFTLVAYDADGRLLNYLDHGFQLILNPAQYTHAMAAGISLRLALDLPAGPAFLRIAVHDLDGGRAGSLEVPMAGVK